MNTIRCSRLIGFLGLFLLPLASFNAQASLLTTQEALQLDMTAAQQVDQWLLRDDVAEQLAELGVDPLLASQRAAAMTPAELAELAERIDELPAGAGVIEVLGVTFLVLIVLDLIGVINIFGR
ncbi:MAG: PA2779 family protein [Wenzhouxiangella sp.]